LPTCDTISDQIGASPRRRGAFQLAGMRGGDYHFAAVRRMKGSVYAAMGVIELPADGDSDSSVRLLARPKVELNADRR
jgi:hypothetical protein